MGLFINYVTLKGEGGGGLYVSMGKCVTREGGGGRGPSWSKEKCDVPYGWPLLLR